MLQLHESGKNLHRQFAAYRCQGEWFAIDFQIAVKALNQQSLETTSPTSHQLVAFQFEQDEVRTFIDEKGDLWFVAKDVCRVLGITWSGATLSNIPDAWRVMLRFNTTLKNQYGEYGEAEKEIVLINESALYKLVFRSNKPEADRFVNWVASEVLPSIRKTGKYEVTPPTALLQRPEYQDFSAFIAECLVNDSAGILTSRNIYQVYQDWCKRYQRKSYTHKLLGQYLKESGYIHVRRTNGRYCWLGLRLKLRESFEEKVADLCDYLNILSKITEESAKGELVPKSEVLVLVKLMSEKIRELK